MPTTTLLEQQIRRMTPVSAPPDEQVEFAKLSQLLVGIAHTRVKSTPACRLVGPKGEEVALPEAVFYVLERVAEVLARGDARVVGQPHHQHPVFDLRLHLGDQVVVGLHHHLLRRAAVQRRLEAALHLHAGEGGRGALLRHQVTAARQMGTADQHHTRATR